MRKPGSRRDVPPPLELACLRALWALEEGSVKQVQQMVCRAKPLAYTTIMTVLERLVKKGAVARRKAGRAFLYAPQTTRDTMRRLAVRELLDCFFDGKEDDLLAYLQTQRSAESQPKSEARLDAVLL
ncbi:MAG: BlaI/MecI/CopY family transcriptional regulator [Bryobacteraceae bacterium]